MWAAFLIDGLMSFQYRYATLRFVFAHFNYFNTLIFGAGLVFLVMSARRERVPLTGRSNYNAVHTTAPAESSSSRGAAKPHINNNDMRPVTASQPDQHSARESARQKALSSVSEQFSCPVITLSKCLLIYFITQF